MRVPIKLLAILLLALLLAACGGGAPATESVEPPEESESAATEPATGAGSGQETTTPGATTAPSAPAPQAAGGLLQTIKQRGQLICGYNGTLPGFGNIDASGNVTGFDADFCRALAAAIFGDPEAVEWRPLNAQERFPAVQTGEVDVLIRNTTHTINRDTAVGLDFAPTTFYDGQGMMVRRDSGIETLDDMDGATVCVQSGTTTELNLADSFRARGIEFTPVVFAENDQVVAAYDSGQCDGFTTDKSGLVASRTKLQDPSAHMILDETMSKEPLAPAVLQGDAQWADVVNWVVLATIQAEEFGITQDNVEEFLNSEDPNIRRFLGVEGNLGADLGLENDFVVQIIRGVGNYGEIYNRNLGPDTPFDLPRGQNSLYSEGGLLYSPPFR